LMRPFAWSGMAQHNPASSSRCATSPHGLSKTSCSRSIPCPSIKPMQRLCPRREVAPSAPSGQGSIRYSSER
jgi:hypothetical protein